LWGPSQVHEGSPVLAMLPPLLKGAFFHFGSLHSARENARNVHLLKIPIQSKQQFKHDCETLMKTLISGIKKSNIYQN